MKQDRAKPHNVLFLCTGNSARSVFGERLMDRWGRGEFKGHSAGSRPKGAVNPATLAVLREQNHDTSGLRSKSWREFTGKDAPMMDFIFTVCDEAGRETCPVWPGGPATAHWGIADPAAATGDEAAVMRAFRRAYAELEQRIKAFAALPINTLDQPRLRDELARIGRLRAES